MITIEIEYNTSIMKYEIYVDGELEAIADDLKDTQERVFNLLEDTYKGDFDNDK